MKNALIKVIYFYNTTQINGLLKIKMKGAPLLVEGYFENSIGGLVGAKVRLHLNGHHFIEGILLAVKQDHLIVNVNHRVIYFALNQIQALSKNAKDFRVIPQEVTYLEKDNLIDILYELKYSWVTINCLSNNIISGLLSKIFEDHIVLVNNTEQLFVQKTYITNIYNGSYESSEQNITNNIKEDAQSIPTQDESVQLTETVSSHLIETESIPIVKSESTHFTEPESIPFVEHEFAQTSNPNSAYFIDSETFHPQKRIRDNQNNPKSKNKMSAQEYFNKLKKRHQQSDVDDQNTAEKDLQHQIEDYDIFNFDSNINHKPHIDDEYDIDYLPIKKRSRKRKLKLAKYTSKQIHRSNNYDTFANEQPSTQKQNALHENGEVHHSNTSPLDMKNDDPIQPKSLNYKAPQDLKISENSKSRNKHVDSSSFPTTLNTLNNDFKEGKMELEKQYFSLMKHAKKMYHHLRDERLKHTIKKNTKQIESSSSSFQE